MNRHSPRRLARLPRLVVVPISPRVATFPRLARLALAFGWESPEPLSRRDSRRVKQGAISRESPESPRGPCQATGVGGTCRRVAAMCNRRRPPVRPASPTAAARPLGAARVAGTRQRAATRPAERLP
jgi:hypothetical protein